MSSDHGLKLLPALLTGAFLPYLLDSQWVVWIGHHFGVANAWWPDSRFTGIPIAGLLLVSLIFLIGWMIRRPSGAITVALGIAVMIWACSALLQRVEQRLDRVLEGQTVELVGFVASLPVATEDYTKFTFTADSLKSDLLVYWSKDRQPVYFGERWRLVVKLRAPRGTVNFQGGGREMWLFSENFGAVANVETGSMVHARRGWRYAVGGIRERIRQKLLQPEERQPEEQQDISAGRDFSARGILLALAIADRSAISPADRNALTLTGTGHLTAISGLHIGLAAIAGFWITRLLLLFVPFAWVSRRTLDLSWLGSWLTALSYAGLAGFGISTQRALIMLSVLVLTQITRRHVAPFRPLMLALFMVLLVDPIAPLRPGFWFSFAAVAALLFVLANRAGRSTWWSAVTKAQVTASLATLPVAVFWFQTLSPGGPGANLLAIPWVSLVVVPLTLLGVVLLPISDRLSEMLWMLGEWSAHLMLEVVHWISALSQHVQPLAPPVSVSLAVLAFVSALVLMLPGGIRCRWLAALPLILIVIPASSSTSKDMINIEFLDIGQGLSVIVDSAGHSLLYDSGPGQPGDWDQVAPVIAPALARRARVEPARILISHADLDHSGGLASLRKRYGHSLYTGNLGNHPRESWKDVSACVEGTWWQWGDTRFHVLHPSTGLPYLGNDSSCVMSIRNGDASVLLTGDISTSVEQRLAMTGLTSHQVLQVPHHGSSSSSGEDFLAAVRPVSAVASTGYGNRFGMPHDDVQKRYARHGRALWTTADCGAIEIMLDKNGLMKARSARRERAALWRYPPARDCP